MEFHLSKIRERLKCVLLSNFSGSYWSNITIQVAFATSTTIDRGLFAWTKPFVHWMSPSWPHIWRDIAYYTVSMLRIIRCNTRLSKSQRYNRHLPWSTYGVILLTIRRVSYVHMIKWPLRWKLKNSKFSNSFTIHTMSKLISRSLTIYTYTGS